MATSGSEIQTWQCPEHLLLRLHGLFLLYPLKVIYLCKYLPKSLVHILYINTVYFPKWV